MKPADPTGLVIDGRVILYFVDLDMRPTSEILYRATSVDGVNFDTPQAAYRLPRPLYDPFVLRLSDGSFRVYIPTGPEGIVSAQSNDSLNFVHEKGVRAKGNMPGAILLADNRVRLFVNDDLRILSAYSDDGLHFVEEKGERISAAPKVRLSNPQPIQLSDGSYLMLYQSQDEELTERPEWMAEIHLATSPDGFNWTTNPKVIEYGGTSCLLERDDGSLLIYYGR